MLQGVPLYTLRVLFERLRLKNIPLRGACIALVGFVFDEAHPYAEAIRTALLRQGARVSTVEVTSTRRKLDDEVLESLEGVDAVVISTDHHVFRSVRPHEFRDIGINIVIPTTTRA